MAERDDKFTGDSGDMIVDGKRFDPRANDGKGAWVPVGQPPQTSEKEHKDDNKK